MRPLNAMLADLGSLPVEVKRVILYQLLDEFLGGDKTLPPELVVPFLGSPRPSLPAVATAAPSSSPLAAANGILVQKREHAGRSMSLREIIDIVE